MPFIIEKYKCNMIIFLWDNQCILFVNRQNNLRKGNQFHKVSQWPQSEEKGTQQYSLSYSLFCWELTVCQACDVKGIPVCKDSSLFSNENGQTGKPENPHNLVQAPSPFPFIMLESNYSQSLTLLYLDSMQTNSILSWESHLGNFKIH